MDIYLLIEIFNFITFMLPTLAPGQVTWGTFYSLTPSRRLQSQYIITTFSERSNIDCTMKCEQRDKCTSGSYDLVSSTCVLSELPLAGITLYTDSDTGWMTFSKDDWLLVFRAPAGIGGDVFESLVSGVNVTTNDDNCIDLTSTSCNNNYRNPIMDNWESANLSKARYSLYKNQVEAAYVEFDVTGSNLTSWFRKERILKSTWTTSATDTYNYFSVEGMSQGRRFYININFGGCPADRLYTITVVTHEYSCSFEYQTSYPQFLYASTALAGYPESGIGIDLADFMAISIK